MNSANKVIKNLAIAFGIFLSVTIIGAILSAVLLAGGIITGISMSSRDTVTETFVISESIENMRIDLRCIKT